MSSAALRVAVIGGGIGGLTAALSLRQAGVEVDVYEQAPELTQIGGGINMGPNAARILRRLGLAAGLDRQGVRPRFTHQRRWQDGRTLQRVPLNPLCEELYGAPHITIHRADLLAVIASGFPVERIHLGHRLAGLEDEGGGAAAWFENGARITADILVGADGIHSAVRAALFGEEAPSLGSRPAISRGSVPARTWCITPSRAGGCSTLSAGPSTTPGTARTGPTGRRSSVRSLPSRAGIRRSGGSSPRPTPASSGRCSIVIPCSTGRSAARHCSVTPATRCTRSWGRARHRRSRTAPPSPPAS